MICADVLDPASRDLTAVREIRGDIDALVRTHIDDLTMNGATR
jgi:hypothetical protein